MASQLTTSPEEVRAALVRHIQAKCGAAAVADLLPRLDTTAIAQCLRIAPADTLAALRSSARLARAAGEGKVATQDGRVWPKQRGRMADEAAIVARMAEDLAREQQDGVVETHHLRELGWTERQIAAHGKAAARKAADAATLEEAA